PPLARQQAQLDRILRKQFWLIRCITIRGDKIISQPVQPTILTRLNNEIVTVNITPATWLASHTAPLLNHSRKLAQITSRPPPPPVTIRKTSPPLMLRTLTRTRINTLRISTTRKSGQQPSETNRPLRRRLITMPGAILARPATAATLHHHSGTARILA